MWVTKLASGQSLGAWGLTEHNTGSDAGGMNTTAFKDGNEWVLNGTKNFITHGISADVYVIIARTGKIGLKWLEKQEKHCKKFKDHLSVNIIRRTKYSYLKYTDFILNIYLF